MKMNDATKLYFKRTFDTSSTVKISTKPCWLYTLQMTLK